MSSLVRELSLADFGLETTEQAAARRGQSGPTVRRWVAKGYIPAVVVGTGRTTRYLVRIADVDAVPVREPGAPPGNQFARKKVADEKPRKTSTPEKSRRKSRKQ